MTGVPESAAVAGLAREVEALRRQVVQLAESIIRRAEATEPGTQTRPPTWLGLSTSAHEAEQRLTTLADWVSDIYLRYADAAAGLPECWPWHPEIVEELLWLHAAWRAALAPNATALAIGDWHDRQRPGVMRRIRDYAGVCSLEQHLEVRRDHRERPDTSTSVAVIAAWWANHRDQLAPEPAAEQLAARTRRNLRR